MRTVSSCRTLAAATIVSVALAAAPTAAPAAQRAGGGQTVTQTSPAADLSTRLRQWLGTIWTSTYCTLNPSGPACGSGASGNTYCGLDPNGKSCGNGSSAETFCTLDPNGNKVCTNGSQPPGQGSGQ